MRATRATRPRRVGSRWAVLALGLVPLLAVEARSQAPSLQADTASAKTWLGQHERVEEFLKSARIMKMEDLGVGVTRPQRCDLEPGGPVDRILWKTIPPGRHRGFWDSYKAEIAAYEMDRLLDLDMVPVAVERTIRGEPGAAIMWLESVESWEDLRARTPTAPEPQVWARQTIRMKMFDNLIGNVDRNAGNLLVDAAWNLVLIDHSRAFTSDADLPFPMDWIDEDLWNRMMALTEADLGALEPWVSGRGVAGIVERRARMHETIAASVATRGAERVFLRPER